MTISYVGPYPSVVLPPEWQPEWQTGACNLSPYINNRWTPEAVERFWNYPWPKETFFSYQCSRTLKHFFRKHIKPPILDLGTSHNFLTFEFAWNDASLISIPPTQLARFQPEARHCYRTVFLIEVIEHLDDNALSHMLGIARDYLHPQGKLIITTPNEEDLNASMVMSPSGELFHPWGHVRMWNKDSLRKELESWGYKSVEVGTTNFKASVRTHYRNMPLPLRIGSALAHKLMGKRPHLYAVC